MNRKEIERKISSAVSQLTPEDGFERISEKLDSAPIQNERTVIKMTENKKKSFKNFARVAVAACLVLVVGLFSISFYGNNVAVDSIVDLDVNPSIELATNKQEKVIKVTAINEDANEIIDGMDLKNTDLKVAVNAIIGSMVQKGYFDAVDNSILVTVQNKDEQKAISLQKELSVNIDETLDSYQVEASVIKQTVSKDKINKSAEELAKELGISVGKANLIQNLIGKDDSLKAEELAKMSIKDLAKVVKEKNIDISDIADYDVDDSIWENLADSIDEVNDNVNDNKKPEKNENANADANKNENNNNAVAPQNIISEEKAKEIALNHAGVAADKAVFEKVKLDKDDGVYEYEVDFRVGNVEYDYEINAISGKIIEADKDYENDKIQQIIKPENKPANQDKVENNGEKLSAEKVKEIALNHAGAPADKVSFYKAEYDFDDGVHVYEIEFIYDGFDYEYEINGGNGKVIHSEKERADFD